MNALKNLIFNSEEKSALLKLARKTLEDSFERDAELALKDFLNSYPHRDCPLFELSPCFVTLNTSAGRLRGCIGCTDTHERLVENVHIYTQLAAFRDPRFPAVEASEVDDLIIQISVLGPLQPLPSLDDVVIGKHGLAVHKGPARGLLLAVVAEEYGWNREEFLQHTYIKAGLEPDEKDAEIFFFEQVCFSEKDL